MNIREKLLKDSFERIAETSMDVTRVVVDSRNATHDVVNIYIRGQVAGRLVTDKTDSITLARRLLPDSLKYDKEPSSLTADLEKLANAYFELLMEARVAVSTKNVGALAEHLRRGDDRSGLGAIPPELAGGLLDRQARREAASPEQAQSHLTPG